MKNKKILHVIDAMGLGGAQTVVKGIFEAQKDNNDIFLFALRKKDITISVDHKNCIIFNSTSKYSFAPLFELKRIIEREKIEILHCHLFRAQVFGWLLKILYFKNIKLIFHEHGGIVEDGLIYKLFLKVSQKKTDLYVAISNAIKKELIKNSSNAESKIVVIYNFVDLEKYNKKNIVWNIQAERIKHGIKDDDFLVGFAGRLIERKGWIDFVNSAKSLLKEDEKIKFIIAGDGCQKQKLLDFIDKNKFSADIIYLGYVKDMVWFYSLLDCFVIPSHWEPMGMTEIEAQAMDIPVIASNVDGLNEVIKDNDTGIFFKAKDIFSLSQKIKLLKKDFQLREELLRNSSNNIRNFSLSRYINILNTVYGKFE